MNKRTTWVIVGIIAGVLVLCCCILVVLGIGGITLFSVSSQNSVETNPMPTQIFVEPIQVPTATEMAISTPEQQETAKLQPEETSVPDNGISADLLEQLKQIEQQVQTLRGLPASSSIDRKTLTQEALNERVMEDFFADYTADDVKKDAQILSLFGLLEPDFDLYTLFVNLYSEQIAGFYDSETNEMVVVQGEAFRGPERMTYAHEYTHALQDQKFDLDQGLMMADDHCEENTEYCAAVQALVEGDATLTEQLWFLEYSTMKDKQEVFQFYQEYSSPVFDSTPPFLQEDFLFPYNQGFSFVENLYNEGGYSAVDAAFMDPPQSTEQILHPEKYPDDIPLEIDLPDTESILGSDWEQLDDNALGEWYLYLMFYRPFDSSLALEQAQAEAAAAGWGGDRYQIYRNNATDQLVLVSLSQWDNEDESIEYWNAFETYGINRWGTQPIRTASSLNWSTVTENIYVGRNSDRVLWIIAPDESLSAALKTQFSGFSSD